MQIAGCIIRHGADPSCARPFMREALEYYLATRRAGFGFEVFETMPEPTAYLLTDNTTGGVDGQRIDRQPVQGAPSRHR